MGAFNTHGQEVEFHDEAWDANEKVWIKTTLTVKDTRRLAAAAGSAFGSNAASASLVDLATLHVLLDVVITKWNFVNDQGQQVRKNEETCDLLDPQKYGLPIAKKFSELRDPAPTEAENKDFLPLQLPG